MYGISFMNFMAQETEQEAEEVLLWKRPTVFQ